MDVCPPVMETHAPLVRAERERASERDRERERERERERRGGAVWWWRVPTESFPCGHLRGPRHSKSWSHSKFGAIFRYVSTEAALGAPGGDGC